jgi:HEPN domain-containing protein
LLGLVLLSGPAGRGERREVSSKKRCRRGSVDLQQWRRGVNRAELQRLARERIRDAEVLLAGGQWAAAYYLAGYAVECALKSCILHHLERTGMLFKDRKYLNKLADCWTHELDKLLDLANLTANFGVARGANPALDAYWAVVRDWKETSRYEQKTEAEARALHEAITHDPDGVFKWIQQHW